MGAQGRPQLIASFLAVVQNGGRATANLGTWDGDTEIHEGDVVLVTDAGEGPYEATVESIDGSQAHLRVHAFAAERRASVVDEVWARQGLNPLDPDEAMELGYEELAAFRAEGPNADDA